MLWNNEIESIKIKKQYNYEGTEDSSSSTFSWNPFVFLEDLPDSLTLCGKASLRDQDLALFSYATNVSHLKIIDCQLLTDISLSLLPPYITSLELSNCPHFTDKGLANLAYFNKLKKLTIINCPGIQGKTIACLPYSITSIKIVQCPNFIDEGLAELSLLSQLKTLSINHCIKITGKTFDSLPCSLTKLTITKCPLVVDCGLKNLSFLKKLKLLDLSYCQRIQGNTLNYLPCSIKHLNLMGCIALSCIDTLAELRHLEYINLSNTPITELSLPFLKALKIKKIILGKCPVTPFSSHFLDVEFKY